MGLLYKYLLIIPGIFLCRFLYYQRRIFFLLNFEKKYKQLFEIYVKNKKKQEGKNEESFNKTEDNLYKTIFRSQEFVRKYILEAGLEEPHIPNIQPMGLNFVNTNPISVLDNIAYLKDYRVVDAFKQTLQRTIGFYEHKRNENFNPIFWLEYLVLKFPKSLFKNIIEIIKMVLSSK